MLLVNSVSHKISLGEDAPIAFGAPVGWVGIAFGAPVGWEPAATPRIELENPPAIAGAIFLCPELTEMRPGHKKTRPFGAGFQAQSLIFSGEGGIRTRGTVTRTAV